ncbi:MAG: helix-turn-helix domain-containing protein [Cytophagales bacterium]|nr:MAG: helix-turn-helix domain-containing protein [Cytophagales bacterium]
MSIISENIKYLRKKKQYTQETFAEAIGIKRSLIGSYEEGRAEPNLQTLKKIASILEVSIDDIISLDLSKDQFFLAEKPDLKGKSLRILTISVNNNNNENIVLIPQKASAGYLNGYADTEFISEMPQFHLPIFNNGSFRAFEIKGDSMLPLASGTIIIGQYLEDWTSLKTGKTYIIITKSEGIVYKRITNQLESHQNVILSSDNKLYQPYEINVSEIIEIWESKAYLSTTFPQPELNMQTLSDLVIDLKKQIDEIKK